eukprot:1593646-Rhodomonas_salina.3
MPVASTVPVHVMLAVCTLEFGFVRGSRPRLRIGYIQGWQCTQTAIPLCILFNKGLMPPDSQPILYWHDTLRFVFWIRDQTFS